MTVYEGAHGMHIAHMHDASKQPPQLPSPPPFERASVNVKAADHTHMYTGYYTHTVHTHKHIRSPIHDDKRHHVTGIYK